MGILNFYMALSGAGKFQCCSSIKELTAKEVVDMCYSVTEVVSVWRLKTIKISK